LQKKNQIIASCALLATFGIVLFVFESYLPRPLPWAKPGLANITTLLALYLFDLPAALAVLLVRVLLGSWLLGSLLSPGFYLSLSGGLAAALVMELFRTIGERKFSIVGISMIGAVTHNLVQLYVAFLLLVKSPQIIFLAPMLVLPAIVTGMVNGLLAFFVLRKVAEAGLFTPRWFAP